MRRSFFDDIEDYIFESEISGFVTAAVGSIATILLGIGIVYLLSIPERLYIEGTPVSSRIPQAVSFGNVTIYDSNIDKERTAYPISSISNFLRTPRFASSEESLQVHELIKNEILDGDDEEVRLIGYHSSQFWGSSSSIDCFLFDKYVVEGIEYKVGEK